MDRQLDQMIAELDKTKEELNKLNDNILYLEEQFQMESDLVGMLALRVLQLTDKDFNRLTDKEIFTRLSLLVESYRKVVARRKNAARN